MLKTTGNSLVAEQLLVALPPVDGRRARGTEASARMGCESSAWARQPQSMTPRRSLVT